MIWPARWLVLAALVLAGAEPGPVSTFDPVSLLREYGLPLGFIVLFLFEIVVPKRRLDDVTKQRDTALTGWTAQTEATKALTDITKALPAVIVEDVVARVDEVIRDDIQRAVDVALRRADTGGAPDGPAPRPRGRGRG